MNEIVTLLDGQVPTWILGVWFAFNLVVQAMPEPKDVPASKQWWYKWLFDIAHIPAGNWGLILKAWRQRR